MLRCLSKTLNLMVCEAVLQFPPIILESQDFLDVWPIVPSTAVFDDVGVGNYAMHFSAKSGLSLMFQSSLEVLA